MPYKGADPMPKTTKTFDKSAYDKKYHQEKYKQLTTVFTKAEAEEVEQAADSRENYEELLQHIDHAKPELLQQYDQWFSYRYPYQSEVGKKSKYSVSELKHASLVLQYDRSEGEAVVPDFLQEDREVYVPDFAREEDREYPAAENVNQGAMRGTAVHRVMECLDYAEVESEEEIRVQVQRMLESQKMTEQEAECVRVRDIRRFVDSVLGQRMRKAAAEKMLYREQPFVIQRSAALLDDSWRGETILVQGIIDAYFVEGGEIVLVDYKTDRVGRGQEEKLVSLYRVQLEDYAQALERMTGMKVKEKVIYSFALQKGIWL